MLRSKSVIGQTAAFAAISSLARVHEDFRLILKGEGFFSNLGRMLKGDVFHEIPEILMGDGNYSSLQMHSSCPPIVVTPALMAYLLRPVSGRLHLYQALRAVTSMTVLNTLLHSMLLLSLFIDFFNTEKLKEKEEKKSTKLGVSGVDDEINIEMLLSLPTNASICASTPHLPVVYPFFLTAYYPPYTTISRVLQTSPYHSKHHQSSSNHQFSPNDIIDTPTRPLFNIFFPSYIQAAFAKFVVRIGVIAYIYHSLDKDILSLTKSSSNSSPNNTHSNTPYNLSVISSTLPSYMSYYDPFTSSIQPLLSMDVGRDFSNFVIYPQGYSDSSDIVIENEVKTIPKSSNCSSSSSSPLQIDSTNVFSRDTASSLQASLPETSSSTCGVTPSFLFNYCIRYMADTLSKHLSDLDNIVTHFSEQDLFRLQHLSVQNEKVNKHSFIYTFLFISVKFFVVIF
jgi:hypothetical protein